MVAPLSAVLVRHPARLHASDESLASSPYNSSDHKGDRGKHAPLSLASLLATCLTVWQLT